MTMPRRAVIGTEAANRSLLAIIDKGLGFPMRGTQVGNGPHPPIQATWDGTGPTPYGWTKTAVTLHIGASDTALELPDNFATLLARPESQARLTGPERATIASATAARVTLDLPANGYVPQP